MGFTAGTKNPGWVLDIGALGYLHSQVFFTSFAVFSHRKQSKTGGREGLEMRIVVGHPNTAHQLQCEQIFCFSVKDDWVWLTKL